MPVPLHWAHRRSTRILRWLPNASPKGTSASKIDEYIDFLLSSEYQTLQSTFIEEVQNDVYALVNLVWRAYNAGRLSPDRLEPDSAYVRKERRRRADLHQQEHLKRMAAK